jgi:PAS domain-containing protein
LANQPPLHRMDSRFASRHAVSGAVNLVGRTLLAEALAMNANSIVLRMDKEGRVTFFNEFADKFLGFRKEDIIGKNVVGTIVPEREVKFGLSEQLIDNGMKDGIIRRCFFQ